MADIGSGTLVLCVEEVDLDPWEAECGVVGPSVGTVYTVRDVDCHSSSESRLYITLVEIINPILPYCDETAEALFDLEYFRPFDSSRLDVFRSALTPADREAVEA